jgi:hypothetical protein
MKRYVISPVIGNGNSTATAFRSAASDTPSAGFVDLLKSDPQTGVRVWNFAFSRIGIAGSLTPVLSVSNAFVFPDFSLDAQMSQMEAGVRTGLVQSVQAYNLDGNGTHIDATHDDTDSFRMLIEKIGKQWNLSFSADTFDCPEGT